MNTRVVLLVACLALTPCRACPSQELAQIPEHGLPPGADGLEAKPDPEAGTRLESPLRHCAWTEVWGNAGAHGFFTGTQMAPNGETYTPLFSLDLDLNIGLVRDKKLYVFAQTQFWTQRATDGITNSSQGSVDFSKREFDVEIGAAWNYWGPLEFRIFGYADNNLNRGFSLTVPYGYNDGYGLENRFYLPTDDKYDLGRLSFLSLGYLPTKNLIGGDGQQFRPGFFARAYLAYDLPALKSYLYLDSQLFAEEAFKARLVILDGGLASRPFNRCQGLEFRLGCETTFDVQADTTRPLTYCALRFNF